MHLPIFFRCFLPNFLPDFLPYDLPYVLPNPSLSYLSLSLYHLQQNLLKQGRKGNTRPAMWHWPSKWNKHHCNLAMFFPVFCLMFFPSFLPIFFLRCSTLFCSPNCTLCLLKEEPHCASGTKLFILFWEKGSPGLTYIQVIKQWIWTTWNSIKFLFFLNVHWLVQTICIVLYTQRCIGPNTLVAEGTCHDTYETDTAVDTAVNTSHMCWFLWCVDCFATYATGFKSWECGFSQPGDPWSILLRLIP